VERTSFFTLNDVSWVKSDETCWEEGVYGLTKEMCITAYEMM
jgi:hypothetical protein